jgi:hypothetical protein
MKPHQQLGRDLKNASNYLPIVRILGQEIRRDKKNIWNHGKGV